MKRRKNMSKENIKNIVGDSFEDLKDEEMTNVQGAGDVDAESALAAGVAAAASFLVSVGAGVAVSAKKCGD